MNRTQQIEFVLQAASRLLPKGAEPLPHLPIVENAAPFRGWQYIALPEWANDLAPAGKPGIFVPHFGAHTWQDYDWWRGAFELLTCAWERSWEQKNSPCHSYSFRLGKDVQPAFDHAWVNRIILFLRRWSAHMQQQNETDLFGALPQPVIYLTHDVDAVSKTLALRIKKAAFLCLNALRHKKPSLITEAISYAFRPANYWHFDEVLALEERYGQKSIWNIYGGGGGWLRSLLALLMDPGYNVKNPKIARTLQSLQANGHALGLHQKFSSWKDSRAMAAEKRAVENALSITIAHCRQHWLRFSLRDTWNAQKQAGLTHDMTLGFNDRIGFRASAALSFADPYSTLQVTPLVLMDSHIYDYEQLDNAARYKRIDEMLQELKDTGGTACIIWHPHVFDAEFGWGEGYAYLLKRMQELGFEAAL